MGEVAGKTVLIAVEGPESVGVVRAAHRFFGDNARYYAINVSTGPYTNVGWAHVERMSAATWNPAYWTAEEVDDLLEEAHEQAERAAEDVVAVGELPDVTPLGAVGDPATDIIAAAHEHGADVVVIGSHDRPWFARLFSPSVGGRLIRESDVPVLVVSPHSPAD